MITREDRTIHRGQQKQMQSNRYPPDKPLSLKERLKESYPREFPTLTNTEDISLDRMLSFFKEILPLSESETPEHLESTLRTFINQHKNTPFTIESAGTLVDTCMKQCVLEDLVTPQHSAEHKSLEAKRVSKEYISVELGSVKRLLSKRSLGEDVGPEETMKRRIRVVYDYYCKQQYSASATFDQINHESSVMTLNKYMMFCNNFGATSKTLNKYLLMERFKKHSEGMKELSFQQFYSDVIQFEELDPDTFDRMGFKDAEKFREKLKSLNIPQPVILRSEERSKSTQPRMPISARIKYTFKDSLNLGELKLNQGSSAPKPERKDSTKLAKRSNEKPSQPLEKMTIGSLNKLKRVSLADLIEEDESDDEWLKEYRVERKASTLDRGNNPSVRKSNKKIVNDLRQRIDQITKTEQVKESSLKSKILSINQKPKNKLIGYLNK